jgi:transcriptional regulator with XRE-family HTH domain
MAKRIGEVLKRAREKNGLKAEEVAALCNVTRGRYYQWEAAAYILPKNLPLLARALGLSEKYLERVNGGRGRPQQEDCGAAEATAA